MFKFNVDKLRELQKANSIQYIEEMQILSKEVSRFDIPVYQMVCVLLVRPTLIHDIKRLEAKFTHGYRPGVLVFYVSITNEYEDQRFMKDVDTSNWGPQWTYEFEAKLALNPHLHFLCGCTFFICDRNHRFKA